jgi:hypothetical protein
LLQDVIYCLKEYFITLVNFYLTCAGFASGQACMGFDTTLFYFAN